MRLVKHRASRVWKGSMGSTVRRKLRSLENQRGSAALAAWVAGVRTLDRMPNDAGEVGLPSGVTGGDLDLLPA
jgi:hypothetical protein